MRPADKLHLKAATILSLVGLARSKQDPNATMGKVFGIYTAPRQPGPILICLYNNLILHSHCKHWRDSRLAEMMGLRMEQAGQGLRVCPSQTPVGWALLQRSCYLLLPAYGRSTLQTAV